MRHVYLPSVKIIRCSFTIRVPDNWSIEFAPLLHIKRDIIYHHHKVHFHLRELAEKHLLKLNL